ncbi:hypothetical protein QR685DRAFT_536300 [Neurospora intermedia]|uniref:Uncharacterized protein n=1 Tax=Neurospora intermedia TaxID=5142 RepID=A0ABR3D3F9_NEUIN
MPLQRLLPVTAPNSSVPVSKKTTHTRRIKYKEKSEREARDSTPKPKDNRGNRGKKRNKCGRISKASTSTKITFAALLHATNKRSLVKKEKYLVPRGAGIFGSHLLTFFNIGRGAERSPCLVEKGGCDDGQALKLQLQCEWPEMNAVFVR